MPLDLSGSSEQKGGWSGSPVGVGEALMSWWEGAARPLPALPG